MAIGGNQRVIIGNQEAIRGNQRTIRASESVATGGRFAATVSASSTGAYLMKEAISTHQCPSVAHSGAITRNHAQSRAIKGAYRLSVPTPKARCIGRNHAQSRGGAPLVRPDPQGAL
jgi:hypothetical protein